MNLIGVSTGAEPPTRGTSFGSVRCKAIFAALSQRVKANGNKDDFITKAVEKLRAVGVETSAPEIQH